MTAPQVRRPRPPLPPAARARSLVAGAVAGALLGVGVSLLNLVLVTLVAATVLASGVALLSLMWGPPGSIVDESLLVDAALPFTLVGLVGAALPPVALIVGRALLVGRVPAPGLPVLASLAITAGGMLVLATLSTAIAWPALVLLGGVDAIAQAAGLAALLGLVGAPIGALVHWAMVAAMRSRTIAELG